MLEPHPWQQEIPLTPQPKSQSLPLTQTHTRGHTLTYSYLAENKFHKTVLTVTIWYSTAMGEKPLILGKLGGFALYFLTIILFYYGKIQVTQNSPI